MDIDPKLRAAIQDLVERKKVTTEKEYNPQIPAIHKFIQNELQTQKTIGESLPEDRNTDWVPLNRCFLEIPADRDTYSEISGTRIPK